MKYYNVIVEAEGGTGIPDFNKLVNKPMELNLYYTKSIADLSVYNGARNHQFSYVEELEIPEGIKEPDEHGNYIKDYIREK